MAYIGNSPFPKGNFSSSVHNGTGSELTFAMGQSPGTKNAVLVFIDGVRQVPTIYNVSGSNVVFTAGNEPPLGVGNVQILVSGEELSVNVPADDSVTTVKILDDAVTADKLADSINTEIAANTAKVTNATHTGDVTGATALTIANDAVTLAKMAGGTDGNLITYDASGDPAYVATGSATDILTSNGAGAAPTFQAAAASGGFIKYTVYTGNHTWLKSANSPTKVVVEVQGGGGGGGGSYNGTGWCGGNGGAGGFCQKFIDVSSIATASIVVGIAGTAGAHVGAGGPGGTSSWTDTGSTLTGSGGGGGASAIYPAGGHGAGGAGGGATGGDLNVAGPNGSTNVAGPKNNAGSMWGLFNPVQNVGASSGLAGTGYGAPGGGGTGGGVRTGGAGSAGVVIVWEYA
jgi:hypothetical protein